MDIELLYISEPYNCDSIDFNNIVKPNGECFYDTMTIKVVNGQMIGFCDIIVYPRVVAKIKWFEIFKKYQDQGFARCFYKQVEKEITSRYCIKHIIGNSLPKVLGFWHKMGFKDGNFESSCKPIEKRF